MKNRKTIFFILFFLLFFAETMLLLCGCFKGKENVKEDTSDVSSLTWQVPDFTFINQNGKKVSLKEFKEGKKLWFASFIFTRCPNICPLITHNMKKIKEALKKENLMLETLTFSVDPEYDSPKILREFGEKHNVCFCKWHFLTGYPFSKIQNFVTTGFKGVVYRQPSKAKDVTLINHPSQCYLVKGDKVIRFYDCVKPNIKKIVEDIKKITKEERK